MKRRIYKLSAFAMCLLTAFGLSAQVVPTADATETFTVANGDTFHDPGGPGGDDSTEGAPGNYPNCNCVTTTTLCANGDIVSIDFTAFGIFASFDWLVILDGDNPGNEEFPLSILSDPNNADFQLFNNADGSGDGGSENYGPGDEQGAQDLPDLPQTTYTATNPSGCLTFVFRASGVVDDSGWDADVLVEDTGGGGGDDEETCELVCPNDVTIDLDPGACCAIYSYELQLVGDAPGCEFTPEPIAGFTGPFTPNTNQPFPDVLNLGCDNLYTDNSPDNIMMSSIDVFSGPPCQNVTLGADPDCDEVIGTLISFFSPGTGTLSFDWDYETEDTSPFWDPFGYILNGSTLIADIVQLTSNFGPDMQSGSASVNLTAGQQFAFIIYSQDGFGCPSHVTISNLLFEYPQQAMATLVQGVESGEELCYGTTTTIEWLVTLPDDTELNCSWDVTVNEYPFPTTTLACNDQVQVSVDQECSAFITTDMILEGGPYGCYDDYWVAVSGFGQGQGGVAINSSAVGQTLTATVTDHDTGNSCWGTLVIEDKIPPVIECEPLTLPCGVSTEPAFFPPAVGATSDQVNPDAPIGPGGGTVTTATIDLSAPAGTAVSDVNVHIDLDHTWSADLNAVLIAPNGDQVTLANGVCGAADDWENVTFDDEAATPVASACGAAPALMGDVQPQQALSDLDGTGVNGTWTLMITDQFGGDGGTLFLFGLDVQYEFLQATAPTASDNCGPVDLDYTDSESGDDCDGFTINRTWVATDGSGNTASCVQVITIEPLDLGTLTCPANYVGECGQSIDPSITGYPTVGGYAVELGGFCNIFVGYWDKELPDCGAGVKIVRTWTILDWCTQETAECVQVIKLSDTEGPHLTCPDDITVVTDPWFCHKDVNLYPPSGYDACGTPFTLSVSVSAGTLVNFGGNYRVDDLPVGEHTVTWTATDDCGNTGTCEYTITVEDKIPPVPLCDEHTVVSLTFDDPLDEGLTKIPAHVFDDGSYDNCTDVSFEARRVPSCIDFDWTTNGAGIDEIPNGFVDSRDRGQVFRQYVPFACCDVAAGPVMVELRVSDDFGNVNTCMVEVNVQDKLPPYIECPPDVEVSCEFWFDAHETNGFVPQSEDVTAHVFGVVLDAYEYDEEDREAIWIDDPGRPTNPNDPDYLAQPHKWGYDGWADDNCDVDITVRVRIFDDCSGEDFPVAAPHPYAVRLVERTFRARDGQGNSSTCIQRIWVIDYEPFYISDQTCVNADPNDGVIWPCDKEYSTCPDEIPVDYPTIFDDNCSLIGVTYEDQRFDFVDNACYKILRTWTVIDWCQYDPNTGAGYWSHVQIIKVLDHDPAEFLTCPDGPVTLCVADPNVELPANNQVFLSESDPNSTSCSVHVRMEQTVYETCSDWVEYDVKVYPNNGSEYLQVVNKTKVTMDTANEAVLVFDTKSSALLAVRQNGLPYNDRYCLGLGGPKDYHRILWSVEDGCGNLNTCEYLFRLEDCKQPSPVCVGLSSVVMPSSGEVTIWAVDFDASSFDDCTAHDDLLFSFSGDTYMPSYSFDCDAIDANGSPSFIIEIWVADEGNDQDCNGIITWDERNKDYCTTFIVIDDNEGVCPGAGSAGAVGVVQTEIQEPVEDVTLNLTAGGSIMHTYTTDKDGQFHFFVPILDYTLEAERNDDHKNGVSTLDLVKIQKHLLGIEALNSPYKLIAADANNSETVSAIDLVELRKLILGIYTELPNNESWRFVDATYEFADEANPWPFAEVIDLEPGEMNEDAYVGVKVGDVNETVTANANQVQTRNARGVLEFATLEQDVTAGEEVTVDVRSSNFDGVQGYQFTLRTEGLQLQDVAAGALEMGIANVGIHKSSVTASWHAGQPVTVGSDDVLFTLTFVAQQSGQLSDMLSMTSQVTEAEAYDRNEGIMDVALVIKSDQAVAAGQEYQLFQNEPNPFRGETVIAFTLPEAMEATMTVYDVTGKVVHLEEGDYDAGYNEIKLRQKELGSTGVLYYRLDADDFTATKKMVLID